MQVEFAVAQLTRGADGCGRETSGWEQTESRNSKGGGGGEMNGARPSGGQQNAHTPGLAGLTVCVCVATEREKEREIKLLTQSLS